ncbi:hypothetical protein JOM56_011068 [Amanita muscaria]
MELLYRYIHECITWLERAEVEEREGMVSEDRYAQGVWFPLVGPCPVWEHSILTPVQ